MNLGDAFTMAVPPRYDRSHLFFVITDPQQNEGIYHIVNITTDQLRAGKECVIDVGDHVWVKHKSFVSFADTREIDPTKAKKVESLIGTLITMQPSLKNAVLQRIIAAGRASKAIPVGFKRFL
jgi:hypothetical protein